MKLGEEKRAKGEDDDKEKDLARKRNGEIKKV